MKRLHVIRIAAVIAVCVLAATLCAGRAFSISPQDPTRLAFIRDPQTIYVHPGNIGQLLFSDHQTSHPGNLHPWQDVYSNSRWLNLASPQYDFQPTSAADPRSTQSYWARLGGWLNSIVYDGTAPVLVIDDHFISLYQSDPAIADTLTSQIAHNMQMGAPQPAFVFNFNSNSPHTAPLHRQLRANFNGLVGAHITSSHQPPIPSAKWDFIVCNAEAIPLSYQGQAAPSWVRSRYGHLPVILSPPDYNFLRDIVWIGAGAAGLWYRPLPTDPAANKAAATHLRATTAFLNRFPDGHLPLNATTAHPAISLSLQQTGVAWAGVIPSTSPTFDFETPANLAGNLAGGAWYNPATDQTIIQPLTRLPRVISVQRPDASLWIYSLSAAAPYAENATTITAIQDWPR